MAFCLRGCARDLARMLLSVHGLCTAAHMCACLQAPAYGLKKESGGFSQEESG